ncbi:hypothetical protein [Jiangella mangrovi]|uniref:Uncharacterized protein n=1 Tax=Jiangella mangrovi TaxID=1524084 RepID=A0A7W9GUE0_9ACTN|nr:hypothetical protein [Jiangella mangrovi]MBB5790263.1 hypothetical protein [Jiangella mangrovi]
MTAPTVWPPVGDDLPRPRLGKGSFSDHGAFVRQVEQVSADWMRAGRLTRQDRQAVLVAAARARDELRP